MMVTLDHCAANLAAHPKKERRRGSSIVRNILAAQRFEAVPLNFAKPIFLGGAGDKYTAPVQLASLSYVFHSIVGQIVCPDHFEQFEPTHRTQVEDCRRSPPLRRGAEDMLMPNRRVFVRYSVDDWQTYHDAEAIFTSQYWPNGSVSWSCYSFKLDTTLEFAGPHTLHFAVCVQLLGPADTPVENGEYRAFSPPATRRATVVREEYWDDNGHQNYRVHMTPIATQHPAVAR